MKITAPISSVKEVEMLLQFGADELYCGVKTPEWEEHFGGYCWMNRRSPIGANLSSWEEIREVVRLAHEKNVSVHITLNAPFYTLGGMRYLYKLAEKFVTELEIDSLIVSDVNFLWMLSKESLPVRIHLSSLGTCLNRKSVDFYRSLGVNRIILPRQLRISEIESIVRKNRHQMEFEVFAINDGCFYEEGLCQTTHALGGPFCLSDWHARVRKNLGDEISTDDVERHMADLREYLWYQNNCGSSFQADGLPNGPCSLCWFAHFRDWGVKSVKIVGREASFFRKMRSLQLVKAVVDETERGADSENIAQFARYLRATPEYCEKGYMCYFRNG